MGCFLGCFGGAKDARRSKQRVYRASPNRQRNGVQNVQQQNILSAECGITETVATKPVPELRHEPDLEKRLIPSPKKKVTFDSNVTTFEHVSSIYESSDSIPDVGKATDKEKEETSKGFGQSHSSSDDSITSSIGPYPPNHRYHNARESDEETEAYGDSDLEDVVEKDDCGDFDEDINCSHGIWSESVLTESMESTTENPSTRVVNEEVDSPLVRSGLKERETKEFGPKSRYRTDHVHSVLNPVENLSQWEVMKSKGMPPLKPQKENLAATTNLEATALSLKSRPDSSKSSTGDIAVDASLSNWLASPELGPAKKSNSGGLVTIASETTMSQGSSSVLSFEDRPILGALTVKELRQISVSSSPRKSPSRSPDEIPIIGTVGTYWNHSGSAKRSDSVSSCKGIPNTTSKYREDKTVNWHSTPFETRLERALKRGAAEA